MLHEHFMFLNCESKNYLTGEKLGSLVLSCLKINIHNFKVHSFLQKANHHPLGAGCHYWTIYFDNHLLVQQRASQEYILTHSKTCKLSIYIDENCTNLCFGFWHFSEDSSSLYIYMHLAWLDAFGFAIAGVATCHVSLTFNGLYMNICVIYKLPSQVESINVKERLIQE